MAEQCTRRVLVAPNMEFFEYLPENRPMRPDIPFYSRMDYGNRVGFWRMLDVLNKHKMRACSCLNLEILDHFPEIKDAIAARLPERQRGDSAFCSLI
jgi:allantoinase